MGVLAVHRFLSDYLFILVAAVAFLHMHISEIFTLPLFPPSLLLRELPLPWWPQRSGMARQTEPPYCSRHTHTNTMQLIYCRLKVNFHFSLPRLSHLCDLSFIIYFIFLRNGCIILWFKLDKLLSVVGVLPLQKPACVWQVDWWGLYVVRECRCHMMQFFHLHDAPKTTKITQSAALSGPLQEAWWLDVLGSKDAYVRVKKGLRMWANSVEWWCMHTYARTECKLQLYASIWTIWWSWDQNPRGALHRAGLYQQQQQSLVICARIIEARQTTHTHTHTFSAVGLADWWGETITCSTFFRMFIHSFHYLHIFYAT